MPSRILIATARAASLFKPRSVSLNLRQPLVWQLWNGLNRVLDPVYSRIRSILPSAGGIDFAPLAVLLAIFALEIVISNNLYAFG